MAMIIPPGFGQVSYRWTLSGDAETMLCTIGYVMGSISGSNLTQANGLHAAFESAFAASELNSNWTFQGVTLRVGQDGGPPLVYDTSGGAVGTRSTASPPNNCTALIQKRTDLGGRKGRGRMYLPSGYLTQTGLNHLGVIDSGLLATIQSSATAAWGPGATADFVVLHDEAAGALDPTPIVSIIVDTRIATQRRRLR